MAAKPKAPPPPIKKKVKPYPFQGQLEIAGQKKPLEVLLVTNEGLLARFDKFLVQVGTYYKIQFELPVIGNSVLTDVRVLKTYDKALDKKGTKVERMAEFRFQKLTEDHRNYISTFTSAIGQKK